MKDGVLLLGLPDSPLSNLEILSERLDEGVLLLSLLLEIVNDGVLLLGLLLGLLDFLIGNVFDLGHLTLGNLERLREAVILLLEGVNLLNLPLSHLERLSDGVVLLLERVNDVILLLNLLISPVGVGEDG